MNINGNIVERLTQSREKIYRQRLELLEVQEELSTFTTLTPNSGGNWANYDAAYNSLEYRRINDIVYLRGVVERTSGSSTTITTLPSGFWPELNERFTVPMEMSSTVQFAQIKIASVDGVISIENPSIGSTAVTWLSLDGITFFIS